MRLVRNAGNDRVLDLIQAHLAPGRRLDLMSGAASLFAFEAIRATAAALAGARWIVPGSGADLALLGGDADRPARNRLQAAHVARQMAEWLRQSAEVRAAAGSIPQGLAVFRDDEGAPVQAVHGSFGLSTDGLGLTPGNPLAFIQALDESASSSPATGIRNTVVWKKLYKFQRDGVVGAIDKLDRFGGCIIADSVGLGKTFEALAIIKYHELRNDRVLVLVPQAPARQLDALQGQRQAQRSGARPPQLRRAQPHRPVARRRLVGRHRPVPRELGQLRPRGHRRVAQLPQQEVAAPRATRRATTA
jgi:hypothetical protein